MHWSNRESQHIANDDDVVKCRELYPPHTASLYDKPSRFCLDKFYIKISIVSDILMSHYENIAA